MKTVLRNGMGVAAVCGALLGGACGGQQETPPAAPAVVANPVDPATAGAVTGSIKFEGTPPAPQPINMESDPYCQGQSAQTTETVTLGTAGALQNVFVYVKDGLGNRAFPVPATPVVLDQKGCRYV